MANANPDETITNRVIGGYVNQRCQCNDGYTVWDGACLPTCQNTEYRNNYGICSTCSEGQIAIGGETTGGVPHKEHNNCGTANP